MSRSISDVWGDSAATFAFWKGRVALHALLRAADVGPGDEVLVPAFTCVVVPAAVMYTGAVPVYYDLKAGSYLGDLERAHDAASPRTRAIIVQHTFGTPADLSAFRVWSNRQDVKMLEDCAHALDASRDGHVCGLVGDGAFTSFQWSKTVTTGLGGIARANHPGMRDAVARFHRDCFEPSRWDVARLGALLALHRVSLHPSVYWTLRSWFRHMSARGWLEGSSTTQELTFPQPPTNYGRRFGNSRYRQLQQALKRAQRVVTHRRRIAAIYASAMGSKFVPPRQPGWTTTDLVVPLRVKDRNGLLAKAREARVELGDWFSSPLHPAEACAAAFGYERGMCPHADRAADEVINLPTHPRIDQNQAGRILGFLALHRDQWVELSQPERRGPATREKGMTAAG